MTVTTHLIVVLDPLLFNENNFTGPVTIIYIFHEENSVKCKHVFAWNIRRPNFYLVIIVLASTPTGKTFGTPLQTWIVLCKILVSFCKQLQVETYYLVIDPCPRLKYSHGLLMKKIHTAGDCTPRYLCKYLWVFTYAIQGLFGPVTCL